MKAKRNLLALLLSVVMLWQGFSVVNAEDVSTASGSTVSLSSSAVGGRVDPQQRKFLMLCGAWK